MSDDAIKQYLASIGSKGGKAGKGQSKRRGSAAYYKRISQLAAAARKARRQSGPKAKPSQRGADDEHKPDGKRNQRDKAV